MKCDVDFAPEEGLYWHNEEDSMKGESQQLWE